MFLVMEDTGVKFDKLLFNFTKESDAKRTVVLMSRNRGQIIYCFDGSKNFIMRKYGNDIPQPYNKFLNFYNNLCSKKSVRAHARARRKVTSANRNNIEEMFKLLKDAKPREFTKLKKAIAFLVKENRQLEWRQLKQ